MKTMILCLLAATAGAWWSVQTSGIDTNLRGVSVVADKLVAKHTTIWASGSNGVILHSTDSGRNWERLHVSTGESLDFRGVQAFDENNAYVMSSGEEDKSRIYRTTDGGKSWELQYTDRRKDFFLDGIVCASATNCFALSDPVDGEFVILHTEDGKHWKEIPNAGMPPALPKEGAFAASNSSLILYGQTELYFATGGSAARVFHSSDLGKSWTVTETSVRSGKTSQGIFSLVRSGDTVVAVGGDYEKPAETERIAAYSLDRGKTWRLSTDSPKGYRSAVTRYGKGFMAVGPGGTDFSADGIHGGRTGRDRFQRGWDSLGTVRKSGPECRGSRRKRRVGGRSKGPDR